MAHLEIIRPVQLSRWERLKRSLTLGPFNLKDRELVRQFGARPVSSGVSVSEDTAMNYAAVWAAVNLISNHIAAVPLVLYKVDEKGGKDRYTKHPLYRLVHDRPNPEMGSMVFRRTLQAHKLVWGNGYAEIERDTAGRAVALWPLLPYAMRPMYEGGRLVYNYTNPGDGRSIPFQPYDILHIRGGGGTGIEGESVIGRARESLGLGIAAERFGGAFFGNGATFDCAITYPPGINLTPQAKEDNRKALDNRHQGVDRAYRRLALYEGAKIEQLGVPPNEAQFLETRMFQIEEVCRWFNIPPHKLKHLQRTSYNSIEHQSIEYVTDALDPDWVIWEQELNQKLVSPLEANAQKFEHVREGMLRGDSATRADYYSKLFSIAAITPNEIRARENLNPVDGGDTVYVPLNTLPLDRLEEYIDAQIKSKEQPKQPPQMPQQAPKADEEKERQIASLTEQVALARHAASLAEESRDFAKADAEREKVARELVETAAATTRAQLEQQLAEANTSLHDAASREQALDEQIGFLKREVESLSGGVEDLNARIAVAISEKDAAVAAAARATDVQQQAEQARDEAVVERDTTTALLDETAAALAAAKLLAESHLTAKQQAEKERDEAKTQTAIDAAANAVALDHAVRELGIVKQEANGAELALEVERQRHREQRAEAFGALRHVFADAMGRMVRREVAKAKNYQGNPQRLSTWAESFYDQTEEDIFVEALLPATRAHLAWLGSPENPADVARQMVRDHFEESKRTISGMVQSGPEGFGELVQRTFHRWESTRADQMADRVMQEEIRHGR